MDSPLPKTFIRQGIHLFYSRFIEPKSANEDQRRKELILNSLLTGIIFLIATLDVSILAHSMLNSGLNGTEGIPFAIFSLFLAAFIGLYTLSKKGRIEAASYLTIFIYFAGTTYGVYVWGMGLPAGLLSYALIITMSTMLLGSRFGIAISLTIVAIILSLAHMESTLGIVPQWKRVPTLFTNGIQYSILLLSITILSRIYWHDIQRSLERARRSERQLQEKNDSLEAIVEERTKELKRSQAEQISQLYRFAEFGKISSGLFHDLINPLSAVALNVYHLQDVPESGGYEQSRAHIDRAVQASRRMERFMASVKRQISAENTNEPLCLNDEVEETIELLGHKAMRAGVAVHFEADERIYSYGSKLKFEQVISNLISNAIDSYDGKPFADKDKRAEIRLARKGRDAEVQVTDKGCGITDEHMGKIFDAFFTTKPAEKGIGIGLSTIKEIVENEFGGTITAKSKVNEGSTFKVLIPIRTHEAGQNAAEIQEGSGRAS